MKIKDIELKRISIPLKKTFKTALRTVNSAENIIVLVHTDDGEIGYGEAPPTKEITGDTNESTFAAINDAIKPALLGKDFANFEDIMLSLHNSIEGNTSGKAALDMALYDLISKGVNMPLYRYLGGYRNSVKTDLTISINEPEEMVADALDAIALGFEEIKLKIGRDGNKDVARVKAVREAVGPGVTIRLDANQGWDPKEAVKVILEIENMGLNIEFLEQPVLAEDIEGLKYVKDRIHMPLMADESLFSPKDALKILQMQAADMLNIKLMKCGGIYKALQIIAIAETYGVDCMLGSMVESSLSLSAGAHIAAAKHCITRVDLDAAFFISEDPIIGGFTKNIPYLELSDRPGIGVTEIKGLINI